VHVKLFYRIVSYGGDELSWAGFLHPARDISVISDKIIPTNLLTDAKHSAFSTNHLTDTVTQLNITAANNNTKT